MSRRMRMENRLFIEAFYNGKLIPETENNLLCGPTSIKDAENWEDLLRANGTAYKLIQAEVQLPDPMRYSKGYFIFTEQGKA